MVGSCVEHVPRVTRPKGNDSNKECIRLANESLKWAQLAAERPPVDHGTLMARMDAPGWRPAASEDVCDLMWRPKDPSKPHDETLLEYWHQLAS